MFRSEQTNHLVRLLTQQAVRRVAAVATGLAGVVHLAVVPAHRAEWWVDAVLFTLVGGGQLWFAVMAWFGADRSLLLSGLGVNLAALAAWFTSRTAGLPFGPHQGTAEAVGFADVACAVVEAVAVAAAVLVVLRSVNPVRQPT